MPDTQWPRFYVFEQPEVDGPMIHAGSVHAADREMALLAARDIFGRRPHRTTMWVVRDRNIYAKTKEELAGWSGAEEGEFSGVEVDRFQVFIKRSQKGVCVHVGEVSGADHKGALAQALSDFADSNALVWWIVRDGDIVRADPSDSRVLFDSSPGKEYRHESHYPVRTMMMRLKNKNRPKKE